MKLKFEKKYSPWKENVKLALQGAALGACLIGFYLIFWMWGAV